MSNGVVSDDLSKNRYLTPLGFVVNLYGTYFLPVCLDIITLTVYIIQLISPRLGLQRYAVLSRAFYYVHELTSNTEVRTTLKWLLSGFPLGCHH